MSTTTPTATTDGIAPGTWRVDPVHSSVGFSVKHMMASTFRGRFEDYDATLTTDGAPRLEGTVQADSIVVKLADLEQHLRSADFFDVEQYPEIRFASTEMSRSADRLEVYGDLTMKGVTRPVRAEGMITDAVTDPFGDTRMGLELRTVVDRREFGMEWNLPLPKGGQALANEVELVVDLEFTRDDR